MLHTQIHKTCNQAEYDIYMKTEQAQPDIAPVCVRDSGTCVMHPCYMQNTELRWASERHASSLAVKKMMPEKQQPCSRSGRSRLLAVT